MSIGEKIYSGGLMRCCTATITEVRLNAVDTPKDGDIVPCNYCSSSMVWDKDGWRWSKSHLIKKAQSDKGL